MPASHWKFTSDGVALYAGAYQDGAGDLHPYVQPTVDGLRVNSTNPLPVQDAALVRGASDYQAGTAAATVDLPSNATLAYVSVQAGVGGAATITIGGGDTITVPAGGAFDRVIPGQTLGLDVVIAGTVASYYVDWVVPT